MSLPTYTTFNASGQIVTLNATPNGGQATAANSLPVVLASDTGLPAGSNVIGGVTQSGTWTTARSWSLASGSDSVTIGAALPAGSNLIGNVNAYLGGAAISASNPVPMIDAYSNPVALTWNNATTVNTASTVTTAGYDTVIVTLAASGAFAGGIVVFEVYDGVNWMPVKSASIVNYTTTGATLTPVANTTIGYQVPVAGFPQFRVRLSNVLSAGTLGVTIITSSAPDTSVVTVGLDPAQPLPAGSNVIGQTTPAYSAPASWAGASQDMRAYGNATVAVLTSPSTAYTPQWSPDNTNWFAMTGVDLNFGSQATISTTFTGAITFKGGGYIRLNGGTGGTFLISGGQ